MSFINIGDILKLCELATAVYKNCRDCPGDYKTLTSEARQLSNVLEDIADKFEQDQIPQKKIPKLLDAYEGCMEVLEELDKLVKHYNSLDTKSKRAWDRLKWDGEKAKTLRGKLTASVVMMNGFWTSLIHDNQVIIIQALGRLERDYAGGHREESMASVERLVTGAAEDEDDEGEDAAWPQIIRDLEDVGISSQDAQEYRDFIVDWFVRAVNEGRLLERSAEIHNQSPDELTNPPPTNSHAGLLSGLAELEIESPTRKTPPLPLSSGMFISEPSTRSGMGPDPSGENPRPVNVEPTLSVQGDSSPAHRSHSQGLVPSTLSGQSVSRDAEFRDRRRENIREFPPNPDPPGVEKDQALRPVISEANLHSPFEAQPIPGSHASQTYTPPFSEQSQPPLQPDVTYSASVTGETPLEVIAENIVAAWEKLNYESAESLLETYLAALESGKCVAVGGGYLYPDRRVIRHLIGVCASYSGNFPKAKNCFEAVFNGIYLTGSNLDEGDIASARWLGDTCLHLNQPENAALAWAAALEGLVRRLGTGHDTTRHTLEELHMLNVHTGALTRLQESLFYTVKDDAAVFRNTHYSEKSRLVATALDRLKGIHREANTGALLASGNSYRPRTDWRMTMSFLIQPLTWPLQYDWTFSVEDTIMLNRQMSAEPVGSSSTHVPTVGLLHVKELHYITKRGFGWLTQAVQSALEVMEVRYQRKNRSRFTCLVIQRTGNMVCLEGVDILFKKVPFRSLYGLQVTGALYATRRRPAKAGAFHPLEFDRDTSTFREMLKANLENTELEESHKRRQAM